MVLARRATGGFRAGSIWQPPIPSPSPESQCTDSGNQPTWQALPVTNPGLEALASHPWPVFGTRSGAGGRLGLKTCPNSNHVSGRSSANSCRLAMRRWATGRCLWPSTEDTPPPAAAAGAGFWSCPISSRLRGNWPNLASRRARRLPRRFPTPIRRPAAVRASLGGLDTAHAPPAELVRSTAAIPSGPSSQSARVSAQASQRERPGRAITVPKQAVRQCPRPLARRGWRALRSGRK